MTSSTLPPKLPSRLSDVVNAQGFAARAFDVIQHVHDNVDDAEMVELLSEAKDAFGAEQAVFASFVRDDESHESFNFINSAHPAWCMLYKQKGWYAKDPWLLYAMTATEPTCDTVIPMHTKSQREARALAAGFGIASAYIVPAPSSGGVSRLGVLILGSSIPGYFDDTATVRIRIMAQGLAMAIHSWWLKKVRTRIISTHRLTAEDLHFIRLEREGKSTKEISSLLGITAASVDSRFQRLNAKFNQPNRRATAQMAAEYGLLQE